MDFKYWNDLFDQLPSTVQKKDHTTTFYYKDGQTIARVDSDATVVVLNKKALEINGSFVNITKQFLDSANLVKEEVLDRDSLVAARFAAVQKRNEFFNNFKKAVFEELNISLDHPKAETLWDLALMNGQRHGLGRIFEEVEEMSQLLS